MSWLINLNTLLRNYPIEFFIGLLGIIYSLFRKLNDHLPIRLRFDKKYYFWKRINGTICTISLSLILKKTITKKEIKEIYLKSHLNEKLTIASESPISIQSMNNGAIYTFRLGENEEENCSTLFIQCSHGFRTGKFGKIIKLDTNIDEMQEITNYFTSDKKNLEKVTAKIKILPKKESANNSKKIITFSNKDYSISCNEKQIEINIDGLPKIKSLINESMNIWMENFID